MARQSRWQQFTDNFNGVYSTFNDVGKKIESANVAKQEFTDEDGVGLTGDALDRARNSALADIYTKYGDAEGGLALRTQGAALEGVEFGNRLNRNTETDQTYQMGLGGTRNLDARTNSANASAAQGYAGANRTNTLLPGEVIGQSLDNEGTGLLNRSRAVDADVAEQTRAAVVAEAVAGSNTTVRNDQEGEATSDSRVATTNAANELGTATSNAELMILPDATQTKLAELADKLGSAETNIADREANARDKGVMEDILDRLMEQPDFENDAAASAWIIDEITNSDMTLGGQNSFAQAIGERGVMQLGSQAMARTQSLVEARTAGGIDAMADAYEKFQDGVDGRIVRDGKGNVSVVMFDTETGEEMATIAEASGPDAEDIIAERLMSYAGDRIGMMQLAAAEASQADLRAQTNQRVADAQTTIAGLAGLGRDSGLADDVALEGARKLYAFMSSPDQIMLLERETLEDSEQWARRNTQMARAMFPQAAPPPGVDDHIAWWDASPEEKEEMKKLASQ